VRFFVCECVKGDGCAVQGTLGWRSRPKSSKRMWPSRFLRVCEDDLNERENIQYPLSPSETIPLYSCGCGEEKWCRF
jgi:hypothetical protein